MGRRLNVDDVGEVGDEDDDEDEGDEDPDKGGLPKCGCWSWREDDFDDGGGI